MVRLFLQYAPLVVGLIVILLTMPLLCFPALSVGLMGGRA